LTSTGSKSCALVADHFHRLVFVVGIGLFLLLCWLLGLFLVIGRRLFTSRFFFDILRRFSRWLLVLRLVVGVIIV